MVRRSKDNFTKLTKNTYRVLLTRGMKGCFVHYLDKDTENFFRSRLDQTPESLIKHEGQLRGNADKLPFGDEWINRWTW